jgi:Flp pilus assembly pilin Flp
MSGLLTRLYVRCREYGKGQTMAEYALILAGVAVVAYIAYHTLGTTISTAMGAIDTDI